MAKLLNIFNTFSPRLVRNLVPSFSGMLSVKAGRPLVNRLLEAGALVGGSVTISLVKVTVSYVRTLYALRKANGLAFVVRYLKACTSLLMQAIAGQRHAATHQLGMAISRTNFGIPRIIPRLHRKEIKNGNLRYIRLWLTLFSIYRVLDYTGKLQINSIIAPFTGTVNHKEVLTGVQSFMHFFGVRRIDTSVNALEFKPFWINSTSPNSIRPSGEIDSPKSCSTSIFSILGSYRALGNNPLVRKGLQEFCYAFGLSSSILTALSFSRFAERFYPHSPITWGKNLQSYRLQDKYLGKLAYKVEPAGKIRVFAMVDCFTQWLMAPLHDALFARLSRLPRDATNSQDKTLKDFVLLLRSEKIKRVYSFDLSAATDRLPLSVQAIVLDGLTGRSGIGTVWASALVDRWYALPRNSWGDRDERELSFLGISEENVSDNRFIQVSSNEKGNKYVSAVRYSTGQPMGALSSWAMLAMTHHVMVHIAALRVGKTTFDRYLVLGDDLVIADKAVADSYLRLAKEWGVGINLSKSVISTNGSLEFAKRFIYKYKDVSGLSLREMAISKYDIRGLIQLTNRICAFRDVRVSELLSFLGHGYKALSRMTGKYRNLSKGMRKALLLLSFPGSKFSTMSSVSKWLLSPSFNKPGLVTMPQDAVDFIKKLIGNRADGVDHPDLPRNPEEYDIMFHDLRAHNIGPNRSVEGFDWWSIKTTLSPVLMPMYMDLIERWDTTVVEVKDTFDVEEDCDFDTLWSRLEELEDIISQYSAVKDFQEYTDVITLNKSKILKRAEEIRSYIRSLADVNMEKADKPNPRQPLETPVDLERVEISPFRTKILKLLATRNVGSNP